MSLRRLEPILGKLSPASQQRSLSGLGFLPRGQCQGPCCTARGCRDRQGGVMRLGAPVPWCDTDGVCVSPMKNSLFLCCSFSWVGKGVGKRRERWTLRRGAWVTQPSWHELLEQLPEAFALIMSGCSSLEYWSCECVCILDEMILIR